jgi:two-component system, LuxR family, sensor kinase FixL
MASRNHANELLQLISEGFVFVDREFCVREINEVGLRMARRPLADFLGRSLWAIAPQLEDTEMARLLTRAMVERSPLSIEDLYTWTDGRQSWLEIRGHPTDEGLAIFYRDISDQKRSEEELRHAQAELMQTSRLSAMGTMAATLAHELAQPLLSVRAYVEAGRKLLRGVGDPQAREARRALGLAIDMTDRASELLKRLREFVARGKVEAETTDLQAIIAEAGVLMLPQAQRAGVEILFRLERRAQWVKADSIQIQQVLVNLIRNAIEALDEAHQRRITIATGNAPGGRVEVTVEDSGPGLDALPEGALFAPFHSTKAAGLGVGLSISRTIVEAHGGTIEAETAPGGGALFRFTLPRAPPPG